MPGETTTNPDSAQAENAEQQNEWAETFDTTDETANMDVATNANGDESNEDDVNMELIDDASKPENDSQNTQESSPNDARIHDVEQAHYMARAEKPYRDKMDKILSKEINKDKKAAKEGDISGFSEASLYEIARLNKEAEKAAEIAQENYNRQKIGEKLLNGITLTDEEQAIVNKLTERAEKNLREYEKREQEKSAEEERLNIERRLREQQEAEEREARINKEIDEIVDNENHPLHQIFEAEYRKTYDRYKVDYTRYEDQLKMLKQDIESGKAISYNDYNTAEFAKKQLETIKEEIKKTAYDRTKMVESINESLGQEEDSKSKKKKKSLFQRIIGR